MAEEWTPQQREAVENRGGNLLVSAAAGSGKTKVLVDRLLGYLTDPANPEQIDRFLIITYTKAAAAELRGKIAAKLSQRIAQEPENRHLQRQMQRLYLTKISTVHAFCAEILRQYAYRLDLPADFRLAEETECRQLQEQVMERLLEASYEMAADDPDIRSFLDSQGLGRDDRQVPEIVLKVYHSARCHLDPEAWLSWCIESVDTEHLTDASQTVWGAYLIADLHRFLDLQLGAIERCAASAEAAGLEKPGALLRQTLEQLKKLRGSTTWDGICANRSIDFGTLRFPKNADDSALREAIKAVREACKNGLKSKLSNFADESAQVLEDLRVSGGAARGLVALVRAFTEDYDRIKRRRRVLDFEDLEQKTLDLLLGKKRSGPTFAAFEIGQRYREVMVDEYQDSNGVQDAIFRALTCQRQNCFMVGDVKQSIYQFRLADPGIFLEKYNAFVPAGGAGPGQGRKVLLSLNFRSSGGIIGAVNDVFSLCMSPEVGGLAYTAEEALREGLPHTSLGESEVELHAIEAADDAYGEEAAFVAGRIRELLEGGHCVRQGDALRPIAPEDIVILLRSPSSVGAEFQYALEKQGIRCTLGGDTDLLRTQEVSILRSLLQVIGNPLQDIPLVAVLTSPVFAFTADDLAVLRGENRDSGVYDALRASGTAKAEAFLRTLSLLRQQARLGTLAELLERVLAETRLDSIFAGLPDGEKRLANLQAFCQAAADYEAGETRSLDQFLEYLDSLEEKGMVIARDSGIASGVSIMSIHKSKGLEFPVVFLCGLSRRFNREAAQAQVLCDKELGLGLACVDAGNRVRYAAQSKRAIAVKTAADSLSEELRVLYVAMTRARDRLIMTYADKHLEGTLSDLVLRMDMSGRELMAKDVGDPGTWVLMAALGRTEAGELFALGGRPQHTCVSRNPWSIHAVRPASAEAAGVATAGEPVGEPDAGVLKKLGEALSFTYAHCLAVHAPSKQTATQLKGRVKDQESAEYAEEPQPAVRRWRELSFAGREIQGKEYGSALHAALQYIRYESCGSLSGVEEELRRLEREGFLSPEQARIVNCGQIAAFFATPMGKKLRTGENVLREFKFSILDDGARYAPGMEGEKVLLQGVVDCALIEADGITVIDFKTDYVTEETIDAAARRYRPQVRVYGDALARIYEMPVKEELLYFFCLGRFVSL